MEPLTRHPAGTHVYRLIEHATHHRRSAVDAMSVGDFDEAYERLDDAELLACEITELVDELEESQLRDLVFGVRQALGEIDPIKQSTWSKIAPLKSNRTLLRIGAGIGAGLAIGGLLVEV